MSAKPSVLRARAWQVRDAIRRAVHGDLEVLDRYFAVVLPVVFAAFYVLDKGPHRNLFYLFALLPMLLYLRRRVLVAVAGAWTWRLGMALCVLWAVSVAWSATLTLESAFDAIRTAGALALFLTACTMLAVRDRFPEVRITYAVVFTAAICAVVTFVLVAVPGAGYSAAGRLEGLGWADHAGNGADIYGFAAVVAMVLAIETRSRLTASAAWGAFAVCVVYLLLAESRAPALGLLVAAVALGATKSLRIVIGLLGVAAIASAAVQIGGLVDFADWIARGPANRLELWADAIRRIPDHLILGAGGADTRGFVGDGKTLNSPHNGFIGIFYYVGFVGGGLFVGLCTYVAWQAARDATRGGSGLALAILTFGLTVVLFHTKTVVVMLNRDWLIFWLPVIIVSAISARQWALPEKASARTSAVTFSGEAL